MLLCDGTSQPDYNWETSSHQKSIKFTCNAEFREAHWVCGTNKNRIAMSIICGCSRNATLWRYHSAQVPLIAILMSVKSSSIMLDIKWVPLREIEYARNHTTGWQKIVTLWKHCSTPGYLWALSLHRKLVKGSSVIMNFRKNISRVALTIMRAIWVSYLVSKGMLPCDGYTRHNHQRVPFYIQKSFKQLTTVG